MKDAPNEVGYDRVLGIYDSGEMRLNTAITFWVPEGITTNTAYARVKKTKEYKELNNLCGGDDRTQGDVGMAVWELPVPVVDPAGRTLR